jgi:transcriptional regulator with XRE-family HTH domain
MTAGELLAYNLKLNRARKGLSQEALASEAGMDKKSFCSFELQERAATVDAIERLAAALRFPSRNCSGLLTIKRRLRF